MAWRAVVRNEDVTPIYTVTKADMFDAYDNALTWLMGYTDERRKATETQDSDEGWAKTLMDNGFFSIGLYRE